VALRDSARDVVAYYTELASSEAPAAPPAPGPIAVTVAARDDYAIEGYLNDPYSD